MERRYYKDYFTVPANYTANMTREAIDETPDKWLDFYPHAKYLDFLKTLFDEAKSVWLTGNYGTGKSNAALVTYKLFMDDMSRVNKWFEDYHNVILNCDALKRQLQEVRDDGILVIYDYNASGLEPNEEFLVRLEKGIITALNERGYEVPAKANLDLVIERVRREGANFFKTRDAMLSEMKSLKSDIRTVEQLVTKLLEEGVSPTPTHYLADVQAVFHRDNIYLNVDVSTFRTWISTICKANGLKRIMYIFDEFSEFIDSNSGNLKTFEDVTEAPAINHFYLVPVTHKELGAFYGENSPGANKAKDRFYFRNLQMPNDIAFRLAAHAMKTNEKEPFCYEWKEEKDVLWNSIVSVVDRFTDPETSEAYVARKSFYDILPIQPMAAFLLKFLAESARSNQRSIFEYLKGSADGREFQEFIATGGPQIPSKQFLTVDYLWKYFMEREDSGQSKEITAIKMEFDRIRAREFVNYNDEQPEIRVLKTVMLFALLSRLNPNGHDRLRPTVENIELSFRGDSVVVDVGTYLRDLSENRHCFSIVNGNIDLYSTTVGNDEIEKKKQELSGQFFELLADRCKTDMEKVTKSARAGFSGERFDIRVSDVSHTTLTNITAATRDKYSKGINKDNGSICLWFVVAKNKEEQMQIRGKQESLLTNLQGYRIIMFDFPEITFCSKNINLWDEYVALRAQYVLENNNGAKTQIQKSYIRIEDEWTELLKASEVSVNLSYYDETTGRVVLRKSSWTELRTFLPLYTKKTMDCCPDVITDQMTVFGNKGLKTWALAGLRFSGNAQQGQLINNLKAQGINNTDDWFSANPNHLFSKIRKMLEIKYKNTVKRNTNLSLRKVYLELQRAPYGMRYNCLSAFTLGFCLHWILDKNCQWTNGQMNFALDENTLAEIIEATVAEKADKEKFICRLSKEDKAFAEKAGCMFGMEEVENSTPIETLRAISSSVETNSLKVPLWVLADYIRTVEPENEIVATTFDKLCIALRISSKGNTDERAAAIAEVGAVILNHADILEIAKKYTFADVYITAFHQYVDKSNPSLKAVAENIEDYSHAYCDIILNKAAPASGWLWNRSDISALIEQVIYMYHIIELIRELFGITGYIKYEDAIARLRAKMSNKGFPYSLVSERYPAVDVLVRELESGQEIQRIYETLRDSKYELSMIYCDPQYKLSMDLIREHLGDIKIDKKELLTIISEMTNTDGYAVDMPVDVFIKLVREAIAKNERAALIREIKKECNRICGFENLQEWSDESHLPAWTLFTDVEGGNELVKVLFVPDAYTNDVLEQKHRILEVFPEIEIKRCQNSFVERTVPKKYKRLNIELASLLRFLENSFSKNPNKWPENPEISEYIRDQYQEVFAPDVVNKLRSESETVLKEKIIKMAKEDPDIGLRFLE